MPRHRLLFLAILLTALSGCASSSPRSNSIHGRGEANLPRHSAQDSTAQPAGTSIEPDEAVAGESSRAIDSTALMRVIAEYLGSPYKRGGMTEEGMDCSAFTQSVFSKAFDVSLPRSTDQQFKTGSPVAKKNIAIGDLVFFNTTGHNPSHVGIYVGNGMFAHVSVNEGVTLSDITSRYYAHRYSGARRVRK